MAKPRREVSHPRRSTRGWLRRRRFRRRREDRQRSRRRRLRAAVRPG